MIEHGDGLLDFRERPRRVKGRGPSISLPERLRAARRLPEAIVKVASFSHGSRQVSDTLQYISRDGTLELEKDGDEVMRGAEDWKDLAAQWATDFDTRKRSRDAAHIVFSSPRGSDVRALREAVRATANRVFNDHEWVFAIHQDTDYPHAHMVIKMRSRDAEKKLQLRKADLLELRQVYAEAAREQGIPLAATPRAARGIGRKPQRQMIYHLRQRGLTPQVERGAIRDLTKELNTGQSPEKPWEKAIRERHNSERSAYFSEAQALHQEAGRRDGIQREKLTRAAGELEQFARTMPSPQTRRQVWIERLRQHLNKDKGHVKETDKDRPFEAG